MKKIYSLTVLLAGSLVAFSQGISLSHLSTYHTGIFDEGAAEIVTYDKTSKKLFFSNADANTIGIIDFSNPASLSLEAEINLDAYGDGVNSVSAYDGVIAVAVEADGTMDRGKIVFFDADGSYLSDVEAGYLPDMVTFTHDGNMVLVANEGEPNDDWTEDPEGSVSIIDVSGGVSNVTQGDVTEILISSYTGSWTDIRNFGPATGPMFEADFQNEDTINFDSVFVNWQQFNIQGGSRQWHEYEFPSNSGMIFARMSGYDGGCQDNEDYLVSESFELTGYTEAHLSFSSAYNFDGPGLRVMISDDFDGVNVLSATWDTLSANWPASGGYTWAQSGEIDLSAYLGEEVNIAFLYRSNSNGCSTWEFDSLMVTGMYTQSANYEPEYIAVSEDNSTAFVNLQENNAMAVINLSSKTITSINPLGYKDHSVSGNGLDASNEDNGINITTYPFKGMYLPDAITSIDINGSTYVLTANEGDSRDYDGYSEEERLKDVDLDPTAFPNASTLQLEENGGRINITTSMGDTDGDGDFDEIYTYGARSFSIWSNTGTLVYDSGDDFEQRIAVAEPDNFNSTNDENDSFDNRSDDKGPEPEAIEVAWINDTAYAFIGLERIGGIMVYDITNPSAPTFVEYVNNRDFTQTDPETEATGDLGCEDVLFIDGLHSSDGKYYIVTSNEISGTVSVFEIMGVAPVDTSDTTTGIIPIVMSESFNMYPNPATSEVRFSEQGNYRVIDVTGRTVMTAVRTRSLDVSELKEGVYIVRNAKGDTRTLIKK